MKVQAAPITVHDPAPAGPWPITAERYISSSWLERESDAVWAHSWMFACLERDVAEPGQYVVFDIARESVVIVRADSGEVGAFYNACQHRGMRLANGEGCAARFQCGYHGWTYRNDGRLVVVPDNDRFPGGVDRAKHSLRRIQVSTFAGLVFICMDPEAPGLLDCLGLVADRIAPYRVQDMTLIGDQTVFLTCNWKAVFDNFGELYHVEHIHPQHQMLFDCPTRASRPFPERTHERGD